MDDPVLMSRVDALRNKLEVVAANLEAKAWQPEQNHANTRAELLGESSLWNGLTPLINQIHRHLVDLKAIETGLAQANNPAAVSNVWLQYSKTLRTSQELLRECLEIIGTLAIRTRDLDHKTLRIADELIRDCMVLSIGDSPYYMLVHSLSETFLKARARIIRLRFPDWTIWDLPLAAHELGHVALSEILTAETKEEDESLRTLTRFLEDQTSSLVVTDPELNAQNQNAAMAEPTADVHRLAQSRVRVLLADAIATYILGPAYACSAITLRLSPPVVAQRDTPSDTQRAHVIMSVLSWTNNRAPIPKPYTDVIAHLNIIWQDAVDRSNPNSRLSADYTKHLEQLVDVFLKDISYLTLNGTAQYPYNSPNDGWGKAREWADQWVDQWEKKQRLGVPPSAGGKLRDVLNATWLCRLRLSGTAEEKTRAHRELTPAAQALCNAIIDARQGGVRIASSAAFPVTS